jgi:hypothetical protein
MGRSKLKTLKQTTLNTFFETSSKLGISSQFEYKQQQGEIVWNNGSVILLKDLFSYPSDPEFDALGSLEITGAFVDEVSEVSLKAWQIVKSRIRYRLHDFGIIPKILGTTNPTKGWVYKKFYEPWKNRTLPDSKAFVRALPTDNPHLPKSYITSLLDLDESSKQRLYHGNWEYDDDDSKLIEWNAITDLFQNTHVSEGVKHITADIARLGSDKAVILVWSGFKVMECHVFKESRINEIVDLINELKVKHGIPNSKIVADEDGVGGGVVDMLRIKGFVNNSKALKNENYRNLKVQCYYKMAEAINKRLVHWMPNANQPELIEELEQVKGYKMDTDSKFDLVPKSEIKQLLGRSPDFSDALMMRWYFELASGGKIKMR